MKLLRTHDLYNEKSYETYGWKKRRWAIFLRDAFTCQLCQRRVTCADDLRYFHCHHYTYTVWPPEEEPGENLVTLCAACHADIHGKPRPKRVSYADTECSDRKNIQKPARSASKIRKHNRNLDKGA